MWIMTNNSYLSIVSKDCGPAELLVRARRAGDIEKVFPNAKVTRQTDSDYLYRAILPRDVVKQALAVMIDLIDYPNFKDSVGVLHRGGRVRRCGRGNEMVSPRRRGRLHQVTDLFDLVGRSG